MKRLTVFLACLLAVGLSYAQNSTVDRGPDTNPQVQPDTTDTLDTNTQTQTPSDTDAFNAQDELSTRGYGDSADEIRRFQRDNNLPVTGRIDSDTQDALGYQREPASIDSDTEDTYDSQQMDQPTDEPEGEGQMYDEGM